MARNLHDTLREREGWIVRISGATAKVMMAAVLLAGLSAMVAESRAAPAAGAEPSPAASQTSAQPPRSSRLKFRSGGPICMCAGGLSEADIQAGEQQRKDPTAGLRTIIQDQ